MPNRTVTAITPSWIFRVRRVPADFACFIAEIASKFHFLLRRHAGPQSSRSSSPTISRVRPLPRSIFCGALLPAAFSLTCLGIGCFGFSLIAWRSFVIRHVVREDASLGRSVGTAGTPCGLLNSRLASHALETSWKPWAWACFWRSCSWRAGWLGVTLNDSATWSLVPPVILPSTTRARSPPLFASWRICALALSPDALSTQGRKGARFGGGAAQFLAHRGATGGAFSLCGARGEGGRRPDEGFGHPRPRTPPLTPTLSPCSAKGEGAEGLRLRRLTPFPLPSCQSVDTAWHQPDQWTPGSNLALMRCQETEMRPSESWGVYGVDG